jgi:glutathione S-transferase
MKLYTTKNNPGCEVVEQKLHEMSLAYEAVDAPAVTDILHTEDLPVLVDEHETIVGTKKILEHLEQLRPLQKQWYKYQSDVCYTDD